MKKVSEELITIIASSVVTILTIVLIKYPLTRIKNQASTLKLQKEYLIDPLTNRIETLEKETANDKLRIAHLEQKIPALQNEVNSWADWADKVLEFLKDKLTQEHYDKLPQKPKFKK